MSIVADYRSKDKRLDDLNYYAEICRETVENDYQNTDDNGKGRLNLYAIKQAQTLLKDIALELGEIPKAAFEETGNQQTYQLLIGDGTIFDPEKEFGKDTKET